MTVKPTAEVLCNLCNSIFTTYEQQKLTKQEKIDWERAMNKALKIIDMKVNFRQEELHYIVTVDWNISVNKNFSRKFLREKFAMTPYYCSEHDIRCVEDVLNDNCEFAGSIGSVFSCIGYIIVNEDERWRLRWYARDPTTLVDAE